MKKRFTSVLIAVLVLFSSNLIAQTNMFTVSPYDTYFRTVDTTSMTVLDSVLLTSSVGTITGGNGLSVRPCSGEVYIAYKVSGFTNRQLGIVNPLSGVISPVGDMGDKAASIAFGDYNHLYAVTGDGGSNSEKLFKVNLTTGLMTFFSNYGNGSDGESIAFCSDNGKIYHWSGRDTNPAMESTDTITGVTTSITRTGYNYDEVFGAVYIGSGEFLLTNLDMETILVDTTGFAVLTGSTTYYYKGLAFPITPSLECEIFDFSAIQEQAKDYTGAALDLDTVFSIIFLSEQAEVEYTLYNDEGTEMSNDSISNVTTFQLDMSAYDPGTYYLHVIADGTVHVVKIVIPGIPEEEG